MRRKKRNLLRNAVERTSLRVAVDFPLFVRDAIERPSVHLLLYCVAFCSFLALFAHKELLDWSTVGISSIAAGGVCGAILGTAIALALAAGTVATMLELAGFLAGLVWAAVACLPSPLPALRWFFPPKERAVIDLIRADLEEDRIAMRALGHSRLFCVTVIWFRIATEIAPFVWRALGQLAPIGKAVRGVRDWVRPE